MRLNPERSAMNYSLLFAIGILGMFLAHFLGSLSMRATGSTSPLPFWWGYPLVFPALASIWIHFQRTFWLTTAIVVCLAPILYFTWYAANSIPSSLGDHPFTILFVTVATTTVFAYLAARVEHLPT
jgi:hypothetical protein